MKRKRDATTATKSKKTKTHSILLNLHAAQKAALKEAAQALQLTESAYLRRALGITLRLDAFTTESAPYQAWFRDGVGEVFAAANLAATTAQALLALTRERLIQEAMDKEHLSQDLAQTQVDLTLEDVLTAGRLVLADPDTQAEYRSLAECATPDATFWEEVDHGREED